MRLVFVRFLKEIEDTKKTFRNYLTFSRALCKLPDYQWLNSCGNWGIKVINWHTQKTTVHRLSAVDIFPNPGVLVVIGCLSLFLSPLLYPQILGVLWHTLAPPLSTPLNSTTQGLLKPPIYLSSFRSTIVRWYDETSTVYTLFNKLY